MKFMQARNYTPVGHRSIDLIVLHDMEAPEKATTAEDVAAYFARQPRGSSGSSAHYCVDSDSIVQCVKDNDVAWHAPGANHDGLGIEHAGYARQTRAEWLDEYSRAMLARSAELVAQKCRQYTIPPVFLYATDLAAQKRGVTTHWEATKAFSHGIGHTDPGSRFPIDVYMAEVRQAMNITTQEAPTHGQQVKTPNPTLHVGDAGPFVKMAQRLLNFEEVRAWDDIKVDGVYGRRTYEEVREFQQRAGLKPDGIVGPSTWQALWIARYK